MPLLAGAHSLPAVSTLELARLQFGVTTVFHFIFVPMSIGLAVWVAFLLTSSPLVGWLDVAMTWLIAGLGMAALLADPPEHYAASVSASASAASLPLARGRAPVLAIALHGALAAATMTLVLLAVVSVG